MLRRQKHVISQSTTPSRAPYPEKQKNQDVSQNPCLNFEKLFHDLPIPVFLDFLAFVVARKFLVFLSVFPFFPEDLRGSAERKHPCLFGWVCLAFPPKTRKIRSGLLL